MSDCIFCKIIEQRPDPELTVFENEHVIAQVSLQQKPGHFGHLLVISKKHIPNIYEVTEELSAPLMSTLRLMASATKKAFRADGINIRQNNDPAAGQDIFHLHFHVIPRYQNDTFETEQYERLTLEIRKVLAERLKTAIS